MSTGISDRRPSLATDDRRLARPAPPVAPFHFGLPSGPGHRFVSLQLIALTSARDKIAKKTYVRATSFPSPLFEQLF